MKGFMALLLAMGLAAVPHTRVWAQDDDDDDDDSGVTRSSKDLPELLLGAERDDFAVNQQNFELVAGQPYIWEITSQGNLEYKFFTDLFRNVWMNQIVINDLEVHMNGAPAWLEFDAHGTIQVQFVAARPGFHSWSVADLEDRGMQGTIIISQP